MGDQQPRDLLDGRAVRTDASGVARTAFGKFAVQLAVGAVIVSPSADSEAHATKDPCGPRTDSHPSDLANEAPPLVSLTPDLAPLIVILGMACLAWSGEHRRCRGCQHYELADMGAVSR